MSILPPHLYRPPGSVCIRLSWFEEITSEHDLVQRVFDDSLRLGGFELWQDLPDDSFFHNGVNGHPFRVAQRRNCRILECGQHTEHRWKIITMDIEQETDLAGRGDGALQHQDQILR